MSKLYSRQKNWQHASRPEKDLFFAPPHFKKEKKEMPPLNFLSRFLSSASFSTFAVYFLLCVKKITHNKKLAKSPTAKELNPARKTKTRAKKFFLPARASWTVTCLLTVLFSIDTCVAQNTESLYERTQKQIQQNMLQNSGDWQRIQEMKMLRDNFPGAAQYYDQQINQIYQQYSPVNNNSNPAQDIVDQQNRQAAQMMGVNLPPTQADIDAEIKNRMQGKPPALTAEQKQRQSVSDVLNEVHSIEPSLNEYWNAPDFSAKEKPYRDALNKLKEQLEGKRKLSVADAYYDVEKAYGNPMLNQKEFKDEVNKCANFIKRYMMENKLNLSDNLQVHSTIQKFFSDSLKIGKKILEIPDVPPQIHKPFYYDYEDYKAEKDYRSYHISKGFATGNGQCHVLPLMYAAIAEAVGAKFYLSYAPLHSFIKYPDNQGNIHSYEVTTNWQITDQWYKDNLGVTGLAEKSGIYLHPLDRKQIVAAALIDLACSYRKQNGLADGKFINECVDNAMGYFPNKDANVFGWLLRSKLTAVELDRMLFKKGIKTVEDAEKIPEARALLTKLNSINKKIESLGYTEDPIEGYEQMVEDSKKRHPEIPKTGNLQKRNLFIPLNTK